ncbi:MAG: hypothetical protein MZV64_73785 [Ignavibacteriales bacterium]|nr:hypothetical protein [Ignavibacteriales bacterium]
MLGVVTIAGPVDRAVSVPGAAEHPRDRHLPRRLGRWPWSSRWPRRSSRRSTASTG